jgi:hypothetical protein
MGLNRPADELRWYSMNCHDATVFVPADTFLMMAMRSIAPSTVFVLTIVVPTG